jgi:NSS family neurotransmitter:Na+ symporter
MAEKRENWGSKLGVILAVAGSAVGLGNFLVFPGRVAANGGGAFLIPYFVAFVLIGIPLSWMEWSLGRFGGRYGHGTGPGILNSVIKKPFAKYLGTLGIIGPLLIFFFYVYIESWLLGFIWYAITGALSQASVSAESMGVFLDSYLGFELMILGIPAVIFFFIITFFVNFGIIFLGVRRGIEASAKVLMPLLLLLGLVLMIKVLTLPNISEGLGFLWNPDLSQLLDVNVWFAATSQIFFTLSVGIGCILTYASYVKKDQDIALSSLTANGTNEFIEVIIGGTIVIPTAVVFLGVAGATKVAGGGVVGLGFITMPLLFTEMGSTIGYILQIAWFTLLFIGGVTSSVSILQPGISFLEDELKLKRKSSISVLAVVTMFYTILVIVGMNAGAADEIDLWGFQLSLLLFGAVEAVVFSWVLGVDKGFDELNHGADIRIPKFFKFVMRYITPTFLIGLLILWVTIGGGSEMMLLTNLEVVPVSVFGLDMTNKTFIVFLRLAFLALLAAINLTVYIAWKYKNENLLEGEK